VSQLREDVEYLVEYIQHQQSVARQSLQFGTSITLTSQDGSRAGGFQDRSFFVSQLEPLREAIDELIRTLPPRERNPGQETATQTESNESFVETPRHEKSELKVTDSRMLSADLAHLRTIQKEVRGLFAHDNLVIDLPLDDSIDPQTATKISRALGQSSEIGEFTLSPNTEIFERVKTNPWFTGNRRRRSGSLPNIAHDEVVITDSPISTIAPVSGAFTNREILVNDESVTVSALHAAMARRRVPSVGKSKKTAGTSDLVNWLRKQASGNDDSKRRLNNVYRNFPDSSIYRN
jgi:hypothetical protein